MTSEDGGGHTFGCLAAALSSDSSRLALASRQGGLHVYEASSGDEISSCTVKAPHDRVAEEFHKRQQTLRAWQKRNNPALEEDSSHAWGFAVTSLDFSKDGKLVLAGMAEHLRAGSDEQEQVVLTGTGMSSSSRPT